MAEEPRDESGRGYQAIADELRDQIRAGLYLPGAFLPTERELQETFRVSRSTVRRALSALAESGWAEVKPKRGVAAKLGPAQEIGGNVAFIDHADVVNERLFFGLSRALQGTGLHLIHVDSRVFGVEGAMEYAADQGFVAAFVWSKVGFPDTERVRAVQRRLPLIALDHGLKGVSTDLITEDNFGGARTIANHLANQGRRRIAISGMMDMLEINHDRFSGFLSGLFDNGLTPRPRDFVFCMTSGYESPDTELLAKRLGDPDRPDAVFVLQDMLVPPVVEAIFAAGLRVPEDVAVASFGGETPIAIDDVGLTTVAIDWSEFAKECVRVLQSRLRTPLETFDRVVLTVSLVVRGSCGAPRDKWGTLPSFRADVASGPRWRPQSDQVHLRSDTIHSTPPLVPL
ncbi:GntR family transcriptional regulator [Fimbriimonas ginsengisoli]|uniref:Transcriptional regulator, GntR family with LacI sensor n=1 Tax=Fimbriimonas ginsengisoli Gsoil 348 TaxID=661478 RepID=A0A068NTT5_FIMGI|nr:GntR family transcriptional regulator [Fimbriimonas ginsengisoli]AIE86165.1 transcriptional regulator, GntR family with LacI sensor [Fimbriimonas ginsengisoli Gsoil 348]